MYRALVAHSDAHDQRRQKKIEKDVKQDEAEMTKMKQEAEKISFACQPDAQAAADRFVAGKYHHLEGTIREVPRYERGRAKADGTRRVVGVTYQFDLHVVLRQEDLDRARQEAGCFVLMTNEPFEEDGGMSSFELLRLYKEQHSIE